MSLVLQYSFHYCFYSYILTKVDNVITIIFQQYLNYIFTDIMDVTLNRSNNNSSTFFHSAAVSHPVADHLKSCLRSIGAHQKLRQKQIFFLKTISNKI